MKPITTGDRGPAVEDIQRRLASLGYGLGKGGVDGFFLKDTAAAVDEFRVANGLSPLGFVDNETWSLLVDATFTMGDRSLYLRRPYFHGRDVMELQKALTVLGFAVGVIDGIFGAYSERAVREFQFNVGLFSDGIAGDGTFSAIRQLHHVWEDKEPRAHSSAQVGFARAEAALENMGLVLIAHDLDEVLTAQNICARISNLAQATRDEAAVYFLSEGEPLPADTKLIVHLFSDEPHYKIPVVVLSPDANILTARIETAVTTSRAKENPAVIGILAAPVGEAMENEEQSIAVRLLDAFCTIS